jgi:L-malate glycosyltransferase
MTILYLISSLQYGGAERQTVLDANLMVRSNKVFLIHFTDGPQKELLDKRIILFKIKKKYYLPPAIAIIKLVKQNNIHLIHSSLFSSMIISAISSMFCKAKVVWHFHSHEYELPWFHSMAYKWLARLSHVRAICFVNKELIQDFQKRGFNFPKDKIKLLYNNATIHREIIKKKENTKIIIGYAGRIVPLKRVNYLVELAQYLIGNQYYDFHISIVGDGLQRTLLEFESIEKGLHTYISFVGFQRDIEQYYKNFDMFINPSQEECLSIALIDAGIYGIPSLAFNVGGNNEIIIDKETGYLVNTKEELFEKALSLIQNKTLRKDMSQKAIDHCHRNFSEKMHLKNLMKLYKEALA